MPIYVYRDNEGHETERNVPVSERDNQEGLTRIHKFTGSVWAPTAGGMK